MANLSFPLSFKRQYAGSLDADYVFNTTAEREAFLTNPLCYPGMPVYDLEADKAYWVKADGSAYQEAGTGEGGIEELQIPINGNLDTTFGELLFEGLINNIALVLPDDISQVNFLARLESQSNTTFLATDLDLAAWINTNVISESTKWRLTFSATTTATDETYFLFRYGNV